MFTRIRNMHPVTGVVVGVVATLVLSGTAVAITDASFTYSTVQTGYLMVGAGDLVPQNSFMGYGLGQYGSTGEGCFLAPVHLPEGARMTAVRTSYRSAASSNPSLYLERHNPVSGAHAYLINRTVSDNSGTLKYVSDVVPPDLRLVSNVLYAYTYTVCLGKGDAFVAARIGYQYYNAGD